MFKSPQTRGEMSRSPPASVNGGVNALESSEAGPSPSPSSLNNSSTASAASTGAPTQLKLTENPERRMSAGQPSSSPPLAEIIFPDEEISKYLAPHPYSVEPGEINFFDDLGPKVSIILMPHRHTLFCERKVETFYFE